MPNPEAIEGLRESVSQQYGVERNQVRAIFAPYRICPLGAHIDHQLGQVTAMALDLGVLLAYVPLARPEVRLRSCDFPGEVRFAFADVPERQPNDWGNILRGAVRALQAHHRLTTGLAGITQGSLSEGGLSSSAAVGVAYLLALEEVNGLQVTPQENILLDQAIENKYLGLRNGILDQSAILLSRRRHLTLLDCATRQHELVPEADALPPWTILIAFSGLQQALVGTDYNRRVAECTEAAETLLQAAGRRADGANSRQGDMQTLAGTPGAGPPLRDVTADEYAAFRDRLTGPPARRAAHFFAEMERVRCGADAWRRGDLRTFGQLITASGDSSIRNYECGAPPLIELYQRLIETPGVYGARFSGAGFRGCCLALVEPERAEAIAAEVYAAYVRRYPELAAKAGLRLCQSGDGARLLEANLAPAIVPLAS